MVTSEAAAVLLANCEPGRTLIVFALSPAVCGRVRRARQGPQIYSLLAIGDSLYVLGISLSKQTICPLNEHGAGLSFDRCFRCDRLSGGGGGGGSAGDEKIGPPMGVGRPPRQPWRQQQCRIA